MRRTFFGPDGDTTWQRQHLEETCRTYRHAEIDIRDREAVAALFREVRPDAVIHCAAQPSHDLAASIPFDDFEINALGTLNLLEATRQIVPRGALRLHEHQQGLWRRAELRAAASSSTAATTSTIPAYAEGIPETFSIDHTKHSLFGASKVAADVLVQEYGRYFGMNTVCFRGGCLTGAGHSGAQLHGYLSLHLQGGGPGAALHDLRLQGQAGPRPDPQPRRDRRDGGLHRAAAVGRGLQPRRRQGQQRLDPRVDRAHPRSCPG